MSARRVLIGAGLIAAASLWMRAGFPVKAIGGAHFDDALFIAQARYLGADQWLGPYTNLTLVKGMFYPLFILVSFLASVPLLIGEQLVYLAACAGIAALIARGSGRRFGLLLFALLAFNPVLWYSELARVIREGLYISLTLGCVGLSIAVAIPTCGPRRRRALAAALGLVFGAFWLTREEGPWLLPALATAPIVAIVLPDAVSRRARTAGMAWPFGIAALAAVACVVAVSAINWREYGVFLPTEFQAGNFPRAYGALARINADHPQRYLVSPADARAHAYAVSPAAAELAPSLEGRIGQIYAGVGCRQTQTTPCPGILSGWFMWALRDAASAAGETRTALDAQRYYGRVAREINQACDTGKLACGPPDNGFAPPFRWSYLAPTLRAAKRLAWIMAEVEPDRIGSVPSIGLPYDVASFADVAGPIVPEISERIVITGWVSGPTLPPRLIIENADGSAATMSITLTGAQDVTALYPGQVAQRFMLQTRCVSGCLLVAVGVSGRTTPLPIAKLTIGSALATPDERVVIDSTGLHDPRTASARMRLVKTRLAMLIVRAFRIAMPTALALAALGLLVTLIRLGRNPPHPRLIAFMLAAAVAIGSRLVLLAYLDATSIPSVNVLYASPVTPLTIGFATVGCWLGVRSVRQAWERR